jgi:hypothetical protein
MNSPCGSRGHRVKSPENAVFSGEMPVAPAMVNHS